MDTIIALDFYDQLNTEQILKLFQSENIKLNTAVKTQMKKFKINIDFFNYFTDNQAQSLLKTVEKLNNKFSQIIPSNSIDNYVSILSKIYFSFNIIFQIKVILSEYLIHLKSYIEKNKLITDEKINFYLNNILTSINNISYDKDYTQKFIRNSEDRKSVV